MIKSKKLILNNIALLVNSIRFYLIDKTHSEYTSITV